ncbi:helix-turn-helix transcriptional regulator [Micromonospora sp. WMMD961]|uniref:helix-turn-helix domain-containing protein n=1 Tax=unclassified Micromonospora TaxID=2617518 RepID=UPI0022B687BA|nr:MULTISPECIES: helix-turn-helix transcriptional regulator [unclassified Micromonospora]MCZ7375956.1 helix-turn-helix transcriptional regulator [Micromonospora sp. WMMC250]MDG4780027.1 helix-turn-helix transcriptional regulator [Micromonospora sp. WMMD961]
MVANREPFVRTLRAQWLGQQMRELREQRGLTLKYVAQYLERDFSSLARYERAEWPFRRDLVIALLDLYGVYDEGERERMIQLAQDAWRVDRWDSGFDKTIYDTSFIDFPWLESRAEQVCTYASLLIPGLLQTRDYAEAVIRNAEPSSAGEVEIRRWVQLRIDRQRLLDGPSPTRLAVIIEESALRRPVMSRSVMAAQLSHLARSTARPTIEIRIVPLTLGLHAGLDGTFWLFKMPAPYPDVAHAETLGGRLFLESGNALRYVRAYDRLREAALSVSESAKLITALAEELS